MSETKRTDALKRDAVALFEDQGHPVREAVERLGLRCSAGKWVAIAEREHQVD